MGIRLSLCPTDLVHTVLGKISSICHSVCCPDLLGEEERLSVGHLKIVILGAITSKPNPRSLKLDILGMGTLSMSGWN